MRTPAVLVAALLILVAIPQASAGVASPTFGAPVTSSTTDFRPSLTEVSLAGNGFIARWDRGVVGDPTDDCFFLHFGANTDTKLAVGDIRLGGHSSSCTPGVVLDSSSTEISSNVDITDYDKAGTLTEFRSLVKWLEVDAVPGFSPGDMIYADLDSAAAGCSGASGVLGTCDLRLRVLSTPSVAYGTMVGVSDADLAEASDVDGILPESTSLVDPADANIKLFYFDKDEGGTMNPVDAVYLRITDGAPSTQISAPGYGAFVPMTMDIRLTGYSGLSKGTIVAANEADHVPTLEAAPAAFIGRVAGTSDIEDKLFLHWGTGATHVQAGDIAINTVSGQTAGTVATTTSTGVGLALTSVTSGADTFQAHVFWVDTNSNGRFDDLDAIYLNKPVSIGGESDSLTITAEDIRLRSFTFGSGSFSAGSVVKTADADLTGAAGLPVNTMTLKFFNADRAQSEQTLRPLIDAKVTGADGVWAAGESVYIEDAATVSDGAIRVTAISFTEASVVATGNPDIGTALTTLANVKITGGGATFTLGEDAYIAAGATLAAGDIRITATPTHAAGTTLSCPGDADCGTTVTAPTGTVRLTGPDATFTAGTDYVYIAAGAAVAAADTRITAVSYTSGSTVSCSGTPNLDCGAGLNSLANAKVSGGDATWASGSDTVYVSADYGVGAGDARISPLTLGGFTTTTPAVVLAADPDAPGSAFGSVDGLYLSPTTLSGAASSSMIPSANDLRLRHPSFSFGSLVGTGSADFTPRLVALPAAKMARWDAGDPGVYSDDGFYLRPSASTATGPQTGDVRLIPRSGLSLNAGSMYQNTGDADNFATMQLDSADATTRACFVNPSTSKNSGFDSGDFAYLEGAFFSGSGSGQLSVNDVRITPTTGLTTNYNAGTLVLASDADRTAFSTCSNTPGTGLVFRFKFIDLDGDASLDAGGTDNAKVEHLYLSADKTTCDGTTPCSMILRPSDIPMTGGSVALGSGGGGGGGGSFTPSTPTSPTTPTTPPATPPATPPSTVGDYTDVHVAAANTALGMTLKVTRSGGSNMLEWEDVVGEAGYEIWAANSPFAVIGTLGPGQTSFTHADAPRDTKYIVTAFFENPDGSIIGKTAATTGADERPALPGMSDIEPAEAPGGESTPGPGFILALAALAVAFLARRRK